MSVLGQVTINGVTYQERYQCFPLDVQMTPNLVLTSQRVSLPGIAPFRLKALTRTTFNAEGVATAYAFKFKFGNTEGGVWYCGAPVGEINDRVVDTLIFGDGKLPFPVIPSIIFDTNAAIMYEVEDISDSTYTISFGFHGTFLFPVGK
jgi:hypothetical protein